MKKKLISYTFRIAIANVFQYFMKDSYNIRFLKINEEKKICSCIGRQICGRVVLGDFILFMQHAI